MNNFEKVIDFNKSFGLPHHDCEQLDIKYDNPKLYKLRKDLCIEEIGELNDAINNKDFKEVIDALTDELYVIYGAASSYGFDINESIKKYFESLNYIDLALTNHQIIRNNITEHIPEVINKDLFNNEIPTSIMYLLNELNQLILNLKQSENYNDIKLVLTMLLYNTYKMGILLGINLDQSFDIVHSSNMSKLCTSEANAIETVNWYVSNDDRYDTPNYRLSYDGKYWVVYNESTGKILKNINYTHANFNIMLN